MKDAWITRSVSLAILFAIVACNSQVGPTRVQAGDKAELLFNEPIFDFGQVLIDATVTKTFTVKNVGALEATGVGGSFNFSAHFDYARSGPSIVGAYPGVGGTCTDILAPGASCDVVVSFNPKYVGSFQELIVVNYFNGTANASTSQPKILGTGSWSTSGDLDITFNGNGKLFVSLGSQQDSARALLVQPDAKILAAGSYFNGTNLDFAVVRRFSDGSLDSSFGSNGIAILQVGTGDDLLGAMALQADGKILLAGSSRNGAIYQSAVVRLNANGTVDLTFGSSGKVATTVGTGDATPRSMVVQSDRKIVVAGYADNGANKDVMLIRYEVTGALDVTFGGGVLLTPVGAGNDFGETVQIVSTKIYVGGSSFNGADHDFMMLRFLETGALDTNFNVTGKLSFLIGVGTDDKALSMQVGADARTVLAGYSSAAGNQDIAVARVNSTGGLDMTFNGTGRATLAIGAGVDIANAVTVSGDSKVIVAGESSGSPALARFNANGTLDTTFGTNGKVVTPITGAIQALLTLSNVKLLAAGVTTSGGDSDFALFRYWP